MYRHGYYKISFDYEIFNFGNKILKLTGNQLLDMQTLNVLCKNYHIAGMSYRFLCTLLEKKSAAWNPFCPVFRTLGGKGFPEGFFTCSRT